MRVAVLGATGLVGKEMIATLEARCFPVDDFRPLSSPRSAGTKVRFDGRDWEVQAVSPEGFDGVDVAIFSAGGDASRKWAPVAAERGAVVVDNSSAWRMDPQVPLVVPEINKKAVEDRPKGIIANPNCSTIHGVMALYPLHKEAGLSRMIVTTLQSVSGSGWKALVELEDESRMVLDGNVEGADERASVYPHRIAFGAVPQVGSFDDQGYTDEEWKMVNESRKIMGAPELKVDCTCTRVPVMRGHSLSITAQFERKISPSEARAILADAPGIVLKDDPSSSIYPLATDAAGTDPVYVGRIRESLSLENGLDLWVASDNIRKGAALNAVQIAELLA
ncbi:MULTISPECIES: aspartate-semialdehyde dehydrogenase [Dethiosulfovibrio]|jgi:aspartate-semialdehyde dehydrogenase|uniref:Aspartate-semialdehyde dehydrogenase n=2 Tax=Dethiosulfovibrio TaxID=47054 RepID=A0ABS9EQC4_9BACT|nr:MULTISPECIES: aspartate-semialdehyde dehydrogenase [Dethiosulfovibrio]MCF4114953.1 aspartate-semialdehyde dehydrogenase [Dethiosulfovibrio russensis]MCF4143395.1 aspartate-semialdehyde dehydrogenase [Dethiosulfovibrio marinus]MCF4145999.1 aspartate-semialdehyde dehydrogenase [Dethiosulfovibrio acidaminovorans]MEA3285220.1 aspartate-semialdehyde dehydrogenase [Synergistota bacterium]